MRTPRPLYAELAAIVQSPRAGDKPWRNKANRIIAKLSYQDWHQANHDRQGRRYKKHHPYSTHEDVAFLVDCLNRDDEVAAKGLFIRYNILGIDVG